MTPLFVAAALVFVNAPDGDTLVVRDGNVKTVLRLAEIDAPERAQASSAPSFEFRLNEPPQRSDSLFRQHCFLGVTARQFVLPAGVMGFNEYTFRIPGSLRFDIGISTRGYWIHS